MEYWFGPVYETWMFTLERFNSWMCQRVHNRAKVEATIMETYRVCYSPSITLITDTDVHIVHDVCVYVCVCERDSRMAWILLGPWL